MSDISSAVRTLSQPPGRASPGAPARCSASGFKRWNRVRRQGVSAEMKPLAERVPRLFER